MIGGGTPMRHRIALVGLGMAAPPHAKSLLDLAPRAEVAYAFSPSAERRAHFVRQFPFPSADSFDRILEDRSVSAVAVLTPPNTHLEIVRRCADAGKHIFLEKPIEITTARSETLVETAQRAGVTLA